MKRRLVDLFCKEGGMTKGYQRAGFYVVGVDIEPQPNYCGDEFIQADALTFDLSGFDAAHASPPCQGYSTKTMHKSRHPKLIAPMRERLIASGLPYVIENVDGAKGELIEPVCLCGSSFGLRVRRHRWFETNWALAGKPCDHAWQNADKRFRLYDHGRWFDSGIVHVFGTGGGKGAEHWAEAMGIDWMSRAGLAEAIPPAYAEWIGAQLMAHMPVPADITTYRGGEQ